ncbi:Periplasmic [NiFeSe] hydrogenase large subunit [Planctomycetes bacterium CA13]|uniref:Periplasmic [NiFeSe] hydrogenase large subunit n=1 Tax=Novipirellula herctigrandis TaxID=2527986 RepID=A0A5C5ZC96_9BACT|nr:Periplasmic [NiFeSe] hydrogenase large subunit [Planctomycetes bacterium CA13]
MNRKITIDPLTRIEGHLSIRVDVEEGKVITAECSGEMFRGFEAILQGRDPMDAQQIMQRICGVCPVAHGIASCMAQEEAYGVAPPQNGQLLRNLIQGSNFLQSHILHFYHLSAVDWIDLAAIQKYEGSDPTLRNLQTWVQTQIETQQLFPLAPLFPRYEGNYADDALTNEMGLKNYVIALEMRALAHQMGAIWCGKLPHAPGLIPGGVTESVTARKVARFRSALKRVATFIDDAYLPDVQRVATAFPDYFEVGRGCGNFLTYGMFGQPTGSEEPTFSPGVLMDGKLQTFHQDQITEDTCYSRFSSPSGIHPSSGASAPDPHKDKAYSWIKAPRYAGQVMEVGPLARVLTAYKRGTDPNLVNLVDKYLEALAVDATALPSVLGRHLSRALEAKIVATKMLEWVEMLAPEEPTNTPFTIPQTGTGAGLTEAARGALGHWLQIRNGKISNYQCVVPTTWNCSPRDDEGNPGATEQALMGTPVNNVENPLEAARVVRSFDPCLACAVH